MGREGIQKGFFGVFFNYSSIGKCCLYFLLSVKCRLSGLYIPAAVVAVAAVCTPVPHFWIRIWQKLCLLSVTHLPSGGPAQQNGGLCILAAAAIPETGYLNQWKHSTIISKANKEKSYGQKGMEIEGIEVRDRVEGNQREKEGEWRRWRRHRQKREKSKRIEHTRKSEEQRERVLEIWEGMIRQKGGNGKVGRCG